MNKIKQFNKIKTFNNINILIQNQKQNLFGSIIGVYDNKIYIYSNECDINNKIHTCSNERGTDNYWNGIYTGIKYQCVELARRFLLIFYGITFESVKYAFEIFQLNYFKKIGYGNVDILKCINTESEILPHQGSLIIWDPIGYMETTGHVAVVVNVDKINNNIDIIEQNMKENKFEIIHNKTYSISCTFADTKIIGWINFRTN